MRWKIPLLLGWLLAGLGTALAAISLPLEFRQDLIPYNYQSKRGVPISATAGTPAGSDGRAPTQAQQEADGLTLNPPTTNQFRSVISFGGIPGLAQSDWMAVSNSVVLKAGTTPFSAQVAEEMRLPLARSNNVVVLVLRRGQIGAPYLCRQISFKFGAIVEVPETDERGRLLDVVKETYWVAEPYSTNKHEKTGYYWSPNARRVFAVQAGPVFVTWKKSSAYTAATKPVDYENPGGPPSFETNGANIYLLYTMRYVVSGSPAKQPRKMYWTERGFRRLGKPVSVPTARVGDIQIVYNEAFPRTVDKEYSDPSDTSPTDGSDTQTLQELRTLWYDKQQGNLFAYNREGRVFVEILGDLRSDNSRVHLGFEIVDVFKQPTPADIQIDLGERITPPPPGDLSVLFPEPIQQGGSTFTYQRQVAGADRPELYATRETVNLNDYLIHWMEEGIEALKWPLLLGRYRLAWPTDVSKYSHYIRPPAATENEAKQTAVALATLNVPTIEYQDPMDRPRAKLTETFKFYTWLDRDHPAHRTLLRFTSGDEVAFERVFSWLDEGLHHPDLTLPVFDTDFSAPRAEATAYGNAKIEGGFLRLTEAATSQAGQYVIDDFYGGQTVKNFRARFTLSIRNGSPRIADGFSFNFGTMPSPISNLNEEGITSGLSVSFDSYDNSSSDVAPTIAIKFNGTIIAAVSMSETNIYTEPTYVSPVPKDPETGQPMTMRTGDKFVPVEIELRGDGTMDVSYKNVKVLANVATGYTPRTGRFGLAARTGGSYATHWVDDLAIVVNRHEDAGSFYLAQSVATNLDSWLLDATFRWPDGFSRPCVVEATADVGKRIGAPTGELGTTGDYLAGHINENVGTSYNPEAYRDPLSVGFAEANRGAIIPVNAIPGHNILEVWWFRTNSTSAGPNAGNTAKGFATIYWPSVIGTYTLQWPASPREIVLASLIGSGTLDSMEAQGTIYRQNDPDQPGYNPNEEHAIMAGGTAFALRDDLNITSGTDYSSEPFVLVSYTAEDGRPAMSVFKVLREKPESGYVFDYITQAGQLLQAPMPLPLLAKPVEGSGDSAQNYNTEPSHSGGDLPGGWHEEDANGPYGHYKAFTWRDRHHDFWVYRGLHAGLPALAAGRYDPDSRTFGPLPDAVAVANEMFRYTVHASRQDQYLSLGSKNLPSWLVTKGLTIEGKPASGNVGSTVLELVVEDLYDHKRVTNTLKLTVVASGTVKSQAGLSLFSTNQYTQTIVVFTNRPPFLAASPQPSNSLTMRYYYKTEPGFDWPGLASPPLAGSIVPYLRPKDPVTGQFIGDPASKHTESLEIVYRPVWPVRDPKDASKPLPTLPFGATLTGPKAGLPGVRDMLTAKLLYQQSVAHDLTTGTPSVVLYDPTREKYADLDANNLAAIPGGVHTDYYMGRYYFPNLPPHLVRRVFFDPNRGKKGALVLKGEYVKETLGESYLLLNVLRGTDLSVVKDLCPSGDSDKSKWNALVDALATDVETFRESSTKPGTYEPDPSLAVSIRAGELAEVIDANTAVDSYALSATGPGSGYITLVEASGTAFTQPGDPVSMHIFKVGGDLDVGEVKVINAPNPLSEQVTFQHTADLAGRFAEFEYEWKIAQPVDGQPPLADDEMTRYQALASGTDLPRRTIGGAGIQALCDNYVVMRYRAKSPNHPLYNRWSAWTEPKLAEGWIKRVLAGINPFNQRVTDLFNNRVNTDVSILTQAGRRWEGDVALNLENINNFGLIEIYETVLRRGRMLSIESGYNYGPANDALLLAAGYLNDLYMMLGGEAWADAANPTIGIGTSGHVYSDIATALFAFKGQTASLLEEELALLRGRDDFLVPGVEVAPVYNRLIWNYTRGIDAGEVIYALNYNIQENPNATPDGIINAEDAAYMYPQGHGDAYGHYLTALKGYYSLLMNSCFDWVPRIEAVNVLGQPVSVDYQDERKFAAAAVAVARAGRQVFDLVWRKDYEPVRVVGWQHFGAIRVNARRTYTVSGGQTNTVRYWGLDHWATRTGQGAYLNWVVGNAILPAVDPNPNHEGIQRIDRTTVPELQELAIIGDSLQTALDNAEGGLSPLGIPEGGLVFDLNPSVVVGTGNDTHFDQIYQRAKVALNNAVAAFDDAKGVTAMMRAEQDSLAEFQAAVAKQELAYNNALIEIYGTPYPDDIGPGKTYKQDYVGPDLMHYVYVDLPEINFPTEWNYTTQEEFDIDLQDLPTDWLTNHRTDFDFVKTRNDDGYETDALVISYTLGRHGYYEKPDQWTGRRQSPGKIQQAISEYILAHGALRQALFNSSGGKDDLDKAIALFREEVATHDEIRDIKQDMLIAEQTLESAKFAGDLFDKSMDIAKEVSDQTTEALKDLLPDVLIVGLANGGDMTFGARAALQGAKAASTSITKGIQYTANFILKALEFSTETTKRWTEFNSIEDKEWKQELRGKVTELATKMTDLQGNLWTINQRLRQLDDADRKIRALIAEGERIQAERETYRKRTASVIQGYRTRDAAFRLFRNEKLERYKTLFDLSARYSLLAANAYDYETGLLNTAAGRSFVKRIINARALGVVRNGEPQYAGSNTGDPGLSSVLAEMKADWDVLRGRLGFNNPDAYGTTVSLRTEAYRILPTTDGDTNWKDLLHGAKMANILDDQDVCRYCMQIATDDGLPVPGIILSFSTTIADGYNLFGRHLAAGDQAFSPSSFATKVYGVGVAFIGYRGMNNPAANSGAVGGAGGSSPNDPGAWYLDPLALSAAPYVYLIPVGLDSMRTPPLGDTSDIRTWTVEDLAVPLPFNIGQSGFSTKPLWQSSDSLTEQLFTIRKHQAFRPVSTTLCFSPNLYTSTGGLQRSQYTNNRLVGRSVWNSQWKLVIPGKTLLHDPNEGLDRFIQTVTDIKLHFVTYSYSGN